jgi:hypothetical protein
MHMALAADRLAPKTPCGVSDHSKEQLAALKLRKVLAAPDIHGDAVHRVGSVAIRIAKARANRV